MNKRKKPRKTLEFKLNKQEETFSLSFGPDFQNYLLTEKHLARNLQQTTNRKKTCVTCTEKFCEKVHDNHL